MYGVYTRIHHFLHKNARPMAVAWGHFRNRHEMLSVGENGPDSAHHDARYHREGLRVLLCIMPHIYPGGVSSKAVFVEGVRLAFFPERISLQHTRFRARGPVMAESFSTPFPWRAYLGRQFSTTDTPNSKQWSYCHPKATAPRNIVPAPTPAECTLG